MRLTVFYGVSALKEESNPLVEMLLYSETSSWSNILWLDQAGFEPMIYRNLDANQYTTDVVSKIVRIRVITKLPNSEQSYKGKVKTHKKGRDCTLNTRENVQLTLHFSLETKLA